MLNQLLTQVSVYLSYVRSLSYLAFMRTTILPIQLYIEMDGLQSKVYLCNRLVVTF